MSKETKLGFGREFKADFVDDFVMDIRPSTSMFFIGMSPSDSDIKEKYQNLKKGHTTN